LFFILKACCVPNLVSIGPFCEEEKHLEDEIFDRFWHFRQNTFKIGTQVNAFFYYRHGCEKNKKGWNLEFWHLEPPKSFNLTLFQRPKRLKSAFRLKSGMPVIICHPITQWNYEIMKKVIFLILEVYISNITYPEAQIASKLAIMARNHPSHFWSFLSI
jgi:hypothetical protein